MQNILYLHLFVPCLQVLRIFWTQKAVPTTGLLFCLLTGFAQPAAADAGFYKDFVIINGTTYYTITTPCNGPACPRPFSGLRNIGSFDRGSGQLRLGAEANTFNTNGDDVQSVQLFYRVYAENDAPGTFVPLNLEFQAAGADGSLNNKRWTNTTTSPNLLAATSGPGRYVLELYFQGTVIAGNGAADYDIFDRARNNTTYTTTFDVTGSVPVQWLGTTNDNWFTASNWSTGTVPTATTDVTVGYFQGGRYPTIRSGVAQVRTLRIEGNNGVMGARNFLQGGELRVFGDFQDPHGGFGQTGGVFTLAGGTQTFDGAVFRSIRIQGGGTKTLTNRMEVTNRLTFAEPGGVLVTRTDNSILYNVDLGTSAQVEGENEDNYVLGILRAPDRRLERFETNSFGNIGISLMAEGGSPGTTLVTRLTGFVYNGAGNSVSVKRSFAFTPANPDNLDFTLGFRYLTGELNGILESNLVLFRSLTGGTPFQNLSATTVASNVLIRRNIPGTLAAVFTLGDRTVPLPVTLTHFTAVAQGPDAVLTWATAQETNSQGFDVQASDDGTTFRKLAFMPSATPNSSSARTYQYRDAEANKPGVRYYRLRQIDLDGQEYFYGPKSVAFGAPAAVALRAYPNPFASTVTLDLQTTAAGPATVSLLDEVGRRVRRSQPTLPAGTSSLQLAELQGLSPGLYVVQVRYHNGQTRHLRLSKEQ
ncbi:T9SS type A sorting domain-containing protein [Hymenobacter sp. BT683]|uniref:T9SS type A sorting domain-containing protein n=1 Tax=Hymenobacter jeongseonensis TaxID=2791027 RepID=A0ABS0IFA1_9BACT|nr:T9SS type A sorting domain-containing protein [Hymenobacter jeongseonensis]MBF9237044.1 T9SS type A sorting domain-containing protein [Hymenobacter jeongseonensis]